MVKTAKRKARAKTRKGIWLIAGFKFLKGLILLAVGMGALSLLHENAAVQVTHWISRLRIDPQNHFIHLLIRKLWTVDDTKLVEISAGTFFYAAVMLTEGIGLALRRKWAEYFTVFATSSLMPLEIYEAVQEFTITRIVVIVVNFAIVVYLVLGLRERKK